MGGASPPPNGEALGAVSPLHRREVMQTLDSHRKPRNAEKERNVEQRDRDRERKRDREGKR